MINPHFDHNRVIWKDEYSGLYDPVDYSQQFDHEWRLFLEKATGFHHHVGVETDDDWVNDRIAEMTGVEGYIDAPNSHNCSRQDRSIGGRQNLDLRFAPQHFRGLRCLDAACGAGRWTKALMALGARVKSIDISEHGLESVRRFNADVERLDIFDIPKRADLREAFDFTLGWGIVMHTHDPRVAFQNVAATVKKGGECYVMVYAPTLHNSPQILDWRRHYHTKLKTFEERLAFAYSISDRPENAINYLDMLNTAYNWVVEEETIHNWFRSNGFMDVVTLNASEKKPCAYHVLGRKRSFDPPLRDNYGNFIPRQARFDPSKIMELKGPFRKENGYAWQASVTEFGVAGDSLNAPYQSTLLLIEDGKPLWSRHSLHDEIRRYGLGRYSHWGGGLLFSTSDNSDPNTKKHQYEIVFAESAE